MRNVPLFNHDNKTPVQSPVVNLNAGANILTHYENHWESLHKINDENIKKAEEIASEITELSTSVNKDKENLGLLVYLLVNSNLKSNINSCTKQVEELFNSFHKVEEELLELENLIENVQFEQMKKEHRYHLTQYKLRKEGN